MIPLKPQRTRPSGDRGRPRRWLPFLLVCLACLGLFIPSSQAQQEISEMEAKARFMVLTAPYVDWPAGRFSSEKAPIRIAVLGNDELAEELNKFIRTQKSSQRRFTVKKITEAKDARDAEMLFIGKSESKHTAEIIRGLEGAPVLTFGETADFFDEGGIIHLFLENGYIRCEINLGAAERARLGLSSKLLTLAKRVVRGTSK